MIAPEEANSVHVPDSSYSLHNAAEEDELLVQIQTHNQNISGIVDNFNQQMEQWKVEKDIKVKPKSAVV